MKIHFSGIGGSGVSAIAGFMAEAGHSISGSDRAFDANPAHPARQALITLGAAMYPQDGSGVAGDLDLLVTSTAVEPDNPELVRAHALGIRVVTRPEQLAELVSAHRTIAVAGTSGKSTVSGMLAYAMRELGLKPNFIGGGRVLQFQDGSHAGNFITGKSDTLVIEACESDGSIVHYAPEHTIVLNLDLDHHSIDETAAMFSTLLARTRGLKVINADDARLAAIAPADAVGFSIDAASRYQARDLVLRPFGSEFTVNGQRCRLSSPGRYNVQNALPVIALLSELGLDAKAIAASCESFLGIGRRFERHLDEGRYLVIDDYAHNPHKISALMAAARGVRESICYIFQPHGFAPTRLMKEGYIEEFASGLRPADHLVLLPIFYAGGTVARDISSDALAEGIKARGGSVEVIQSRDELIGRVGHAGKWDGYIVMGARDETLSLLAARIAQELKSRTPAVRR